jgi:hypothetical protein
MNNARGRPLGIGHTLTPWGAHFLAVYTSDFALDMTVIRYLEAGLIAGEACLWITASDSPARRVRRATCRTGSPIAPFVDTPMLTAVSFREWYFPNGHLEADRVANRWAAVVDTARRKGFVGSRVFAEIDWATERERDDFIAYEYAAGCTFTSQPILVTCAYADESVRGEPLERLRPAHDNVLSESGSPITFYFGSGDHAHQGSTYQ